MREDLRIESEKLARSWEQHDPAWLRDYLVAGVEDPRLNIQSILSRHFLIRALMADPPESIMAEEYRFAAILGWLTSKPELSADPETRTVVLDALNRGSDNAEGLEIPPFISLAFKKLPFSTNGVQVENYLEKFLHGEPMDRTLNAFAVVWQSVLPNLVKPEIGRPEGRFSSTNPSPSKSPPRLSLIEPACGSANDYRFLHQYGIAPMLEYVGFDLCAKNVENARSLFPETHFTQGNVFEIAAPDKSFDVCVVHDLFEHLSPTGIDRAVDEVCRVTRRGMCLGFFQMAEIPEHVVRPVDNYHWNLLSMARMKQLFAQHGFATQAIHIDTFLYKHSGAPATHNPEAYTFILRGFNSSR